MARSATRVPRPTSSSSRSTARSSKTTWRSRRSGSDARARELTNALLPQAHADEAVHAEVELPPDPRFGADDDAVAEQGADTAARSEGAFRVGGGCVAEGLGRTEDAGAADDERRDALPGWGEVDGHVARQHQVGVVLAPDVGDFGAQAHARRDV